MIACIVVKSNMCQCIVYMGFYYYLSTFLEKQFKFYNVDECFIANGKVGAYSQFNIHNYDMSETVNKRCFIEWLVRKQPSRGVNVSIVTK